MTTRLLRPPSASVWPWTTRQGPMATSATPTRHEVRASTCRRTVTITNKNAIEFHYSIGLLTEIAAYLHSKTSTFKFISQKKVGAMWLWHRGIFREKYYFDQPGLARLFFFSKNFFAMLKQGRWLSKVQTNLNCAIGHFSKPHQQVCRPWSRNAAELRHGSDPVSFKSIASNSHRVPVSVLAHCNLCFLPHRRQDSSAKFHYATTTGFIMRSTAGTYKSATPCTSFIAMT